MVLWKLERRNYGGNIKYQNLHTFKEGLILLCQSILETRRITHLHGSAHFTIPLNHLNLERKENVQQITCHIYLNLNISRTKKSRNKL